MKTFISFLCFLLLSISTISAQDVLENIEQNILAAYGKSVQTQSDQFQPIIEALEKAYQQDQKNIVNYWITFAMYRSAILQMNAKQREQALKTLDKGIARLKALKNPTSEDLVLHASILSLSINFQPEIAAILSAEAGALYEKAIKMNDKNLRAYLGIGRSDFYKPKEYGGGYKVESYLKQALAKPDASTDDPYAPTWGRDDAYYYLASYYQREGRTDEAKLFCSRGLKLFRSNYLLQQLMDKL